MCVQMTGKNDTGNSWVIKIVNLSNLLMVTQGYIFFKCHLNVHLNMVNCVKCCHIPTQLIFKVYKYISIYIVHVYKYRTKELIKTQVVFNIQFTD